MYRILVALDAPAQRVAGGRRCNGQTVVNAGFDLGSFFVVVPGHQLKSGQLLARVVELVDLRKRLQPGLPALLPHDAVGSPGCKSVIKALVGGSDGFRIGLGETCVVEASQIPNAIVRSGRHDPRITPPAQRVGETAVVLKPEKRLRRQCSRDLTPIDRVRKVHIEVGNDGPALRPHVSRRREVGLLDVLQLIDQSCLRRAART